MAVKFEIVITDDAAHLAKTAANIFATTAKNCVAQKDSCAVALSGGSTPRILHRILAKEPYCTDIPWDKIHIFWVDERCVPEDHPASNFGLAKKDFLDQIPIRVEHIHPMPAAVAPKEGAEKYQRELEAFFQIKEQGFPVFDLIFLGVGKDGHTASLFPAKSSMKSLEKWVAVAKGGIPSIYRLTLTYDVLNRSKQICFLVSGKEKAQIVKSVFENKEAHLPAQEIQPMNGKLTWLLDKTAACLLSEEKIREAS